METKVKNLYITLSDENFAELNSAYDRLFVASTEVEAALAEAKTAKSERINKGKLPEAEKDHARFWEREHVLFVAATKANLAVDAMHPLLQPVWDACQKLRQFEATTHTRVYENRYILQSNVVAAEKLYRQGCVTYFGHGFDRGTPSVHELFNVKDDEPREWAVMKAAQGSGYHFHGSPSRDGQTPPPGPYMTKCEANFDGWTWSEYADDVGGSATLVNVRTGQKLSPCNPKSFTDKYGEYR
jgi:hypothetical protein